jgi:hypothetical protein
LGNSYNDRDYHYSVLGLKPGASSAELRDAYLDLVRVWHPDRFADAHLRDLAGRKLSEINDAYNALRDFHPTGPEAPSGKSSDAAGGSTWTSSAARSNAPWFAGLPLSLFLSRLPMMLLMVAGLGIGASIVVRFLNESARQLEAMSGRALRIAHRAGPDWADALQGWDGDLPRGMERFLAIYSPAAPAANDRGIQVSEIRTVSPVRTKSSARSAVEVRLHDRTDEEVMISFTKTHAVSLPLVSGVGKIQLHNRTNEEVVIRLANTRIRALRTIGLATDTDATFGGFDPDIYWVDVVFPRSARLPIRVGPLMFVETETARELTADCYEITLKPLAASR